MIKYICSCGQNYGFGGSFGGSTQTCRHCNSTFIVPLDPGHEAMKRMEYAVIPQGTHHGRACSRLVRYGKDPKVEVFWDQLSKTHYERLTWVDKTIWVKSDEIDRLKQSAKGKRKPFPVKITEVTPPEGMVLIGAIETR